MKNLIKTTFFLVAASVLIPACTTMEPDYSRPKLPVHDAFVGDSLATSAGKEHFAFLGWRNFYKDEHLKELIAIGLENNRDMFVAVKNVEKFEAQYRITRSALFPNVNAGASWQRSRTPETVSPLGQASTNNSFGMNIGLVSYEADIWGRIRSLKGQAWESYLAMTETCRTVKLTLVASIALQYFACELTKEQLAIATDSLALAEKFRTLTQDNYKNGTATELDLTTAEAQYQSALDSVEQLKAQDAQGKNALLLLLGAKDFPKSGNAASPLESVNLAENIPAGLPSELLNARPDILAAEHTLRAANANIGAARAAFFPSVSLSASAGLASTELSDLFKGSARTWSFMPSINVPIFNGGRLKAELDVAKLQKEIEIANYEKAIQTAFKEVADEFAVLNTVEKRLAAQKELIAAQKKRYELTDKIYQIGSGSAFEVISAQQAYNNARQSLIATYYTRIASQIKLYKALGGGWAEGNSEAENSKQNIPVLKAGTSADEYEEDTSLVPAACSVMAEATLEDE